MKSMTESERARAHEIVIGKLERGLIGDAEAINQERQRLRDAVVEANRTKYTTEIRSMYEGWLLDGVAYKATFALLAFERLHGLENK